MINTGNMIDNLGSFKPKNGLCDLPEGKTWVVAVCIWLDVEFLDLENNVLNQICIGK